MTRSKKKVKERRGKIGYVIALLISLSLIVGYFTFMYNADTQLGGSVKEISEKRNSNSYEIIDGRLIWNLSEFQSFYGLNDSIVNKYQDTIEYFIKNHKEDDEFKKEIEEYIFLKKNKLLFTPCHFLIVDDKECSIYFSEEDNNQIGQSDWFNKNKKEKLHTFIKMKIIKLKDAIFICEEILEINQRQLTVEEQNK